MEAMIAIVTQITAIMTILALVLLEEVGLVCISRFTWGIVVSFPTAEDEGEEEGVSEVLGVEVV